MAFARCSLARCLRNACALGTVILTACVAARHAPPPAAAPAPEILNDWHGLILMPFGTALKESPIALHEVWVFHDTAPGAAGNGDNDKDCYTIDRAAAPQWFGRRADDYMLCFEHDRLTRIEATVQLPADSAGMLFAAACAAWWKTSAPPAQGASPPADGCDGRDGGTGFSANLRADPQQPVATLSISLSSAADP